MEDGDKIDWKLRPWRLSAMELGIDDPDLARFWTWRDSFEDGRNSQRVTYTAVCTLFIDPPKPKVLTWRDVFEVKNIGWEFSSFCHHARAAGYRYALWNDRVIRLKSETQTKWTAADIDAGTALVTEESDT